MSDKKLFQICDEKYSKLFSYLQKPFLSIAIGCDQLQSFSKWYLFKVSMQRCFYNPPLNWFPTRRKLVVNMHVRFSWLVSETNFVNSIFKKIFLQIHDFKFTAEKRFIVLKILSQIFVMIRIFWTDVAYWVIALNSFHYYKVEFPFCYIFQRAKAKLKWHILLKQHLYA